MSAAWSIWPIAPTPACTSSDSPARPAASRAATEEHAMARDGIRIFDADTHIIEPVEPIEAYLSSADRARLAALGPLVQRAPAKARMSRYVIGKRPKLNRKLGSLERVDPPSATARGARDGGTPWDVRWQGPPFPSDRVSLDPHARVRDMHAEGIGVNMILPRGGAPGLGGHGVVV